MSSRWQSSATVVCTAKVFAMMKLRHCAPPTPPWETWIVPCVVSESSTVLLASVTLSVQTTDCGLDTALTFRFWSQSFALIRYVPGSSVKDATSTGSSVAGMLFVPVTSERVWTAPPLGPGSP